MSSNMNESVQSLYQSDVWTVKEHMYLCSAVSRNGEQNWSAVSRALQAQNIEKNRPEDWFSTANCATQYTKLFTKVESPQKSRDESTGEIEEDLVNKNLQRERIDELHRIIQSTKSQHDKTLRELQLLESGQIDEQLDQMWEDIVDEQFKEEMEELAYSEWWEEREKAIQQAQKGKAMSSHTTKSSEDVKPASTTSSDLPEDISEESSSSLHKSESVEVEDSVSPAKETNQTLNHVTLDTILNPVIADIKIEPAEPLVIKTDDNDVCTADVPEEAIPQIKQETPDIPEVKPVEEDITEPVVIMSKEPVIPSPVKQVPVMDPAEIARREAINELYDNITEDHDAYVKKPSDAEPEKVSPVKISKESPPEASSIKTEDSQKRNRTKKRSQESMEPDDTSFEPPKKITRHEVKKEELKLEPDDQERKLTRSAVKDESDDDTSRDSTEVKEILMFARSDRRRVYGHDDTASPVISESTPSSPASTYYGDDCESEKAYKSWKKAIVLIWNEISAHKNASIFLRPITEDKVRGYHSIVYKPTDLQTIKRQIETGGVRTTVEFQRELMLMFLNARMYNKEDHDIAKMSTQMMHDATAIIEEFVNAQSLARTMETPQKTLRRETRESCAKKNEADSKRHKNDEKSTKRRKN